MTKLIYAEIKRTLLSPFLWIAIIIIVGVNANEILMCSYNMPLRLTSFLFEHTATLGIILSVLIPLHTGQEFEYRTINNKISMGYKRSQIYTTETIVSAFCAFVLLFMDCFFAILFSAIRQYESNSKISIHAICINFIIILFSLCTISALYTAIIMIVHQRTVSVVIAAILALSLLNSGETAVFYLHQPPYRNYVTEDGITTDKLIENSIYLSGDARTFTNFHIFASPFAQLKYEPFILTETLTEKKDNSFYLQSCPYHFEYGIANITEILCFSFLG